MTPDPKTYDEWLALTDDERREVHRNIWDTHARDGIAIAYTAASRLALRCGRKVLNIAIGTYHGGEYLLHMVVSPEEFKNCPPMLEDEFDGFRVVWIPAQDFHLPDKSGATLEGTWISDDGYYEFAIARNDAGVGINGNIAGTPAEFYIEHSVLNMGIVLFSAYDPLRGVSTQHAFRLIAPDTAEDNLTSPHRFRRKLSREGEQIVATDRHEPHNINPNALP